MKSKKVVAEHRCALCGRPIKGTRRAVPGIGMLGPRCYAKFGAYETVLAQYGAEELFLTGSMRVGENEGPDRTRQVNALLDRLKRGGVRYQVEHGRDESTGEGYAVIRVLGLPKKAKLRKRAMDVWTEWAKEVERRDIERKFGFGEVDK